MKLVKAVRTLTKALRKDADLRYAYKANIAVQFQDVAHRYKKKENKQYLNRHDIHKISNIAADEFLNLLCKY